MSRPHLGAHVRTAIITLSLHWSDDQILKALKTPELWLTSCRCSHCYFMALHSQSSRLRRISCWLWVLEFRKREFLSLSLYFVRQLRQEQFPVLLSNVHSISSVSQKPSHLVCSHPLISLRGAGKSTRGSEKERRDHFCSLFKKTCRAKAQLIDFPLKPERHRSLWTATWLEFKIKYPLVDCRHEMKPVVVLNQVVCECGDRLDLTVKPT